MIAPRRLLASAVALALLVASVPPGVWAAEQARGPETGARVTAAFVAPITAAMPAALAPSTLAAAPDASAASPAPAAVAADAVSADASAQPQASAQAAESAAAELRAAAPGPRSGAASGFQADASASVVFDGGSARRGFLGGLVTGSLGRLKASPLGRFLPEGPRGSSNLDFHHGPALTPLTLKQQAAYGLKWGVYLTGLAEIVRQGVVSLSGLLPWQATFSQIGPKIAHIPVIGSWLPEFAAGAVSRMELLADWGPQQLAHALSSQPWTFLFYELPKAVAWETLYYQAFLFGGAVVALRALKPAAEALRRRLTQADDASLFGLKRVLAVVPAVMLALSAWAFPAAALFAAVAFGKAHLGAWGLSAGAFLIPAVLGAALSYITYKTRSFVPALVAHFSYNALLVTGILLAAASAQAAGMFSTLVPLAAVGLLGYGYYRHLRASAPGWAWLKKATAASAGLAATAGAGVLAVSLLAGPVTQAPGVLQTAAQKPAPIHLVQPGDKDMTVEQIVAANKPAVAQIVVRMAGGTETGSGSIIDPRGLMVTNNHVIDAVGIGGHALIRLNDGETVPGTVLAANKEIDLAFVQIEADAPEAGWPVVALGDSDELKEGQKVVAMGYPFGFPFTVTSGIVSGLGEGSRRPYQIQHDAAVNPGNSGGPLFDMKGRLIGVNTAIYSKTGNFAGVSYARSSDQVFEALQQYQQTGTISPGWLGIVIDKANPLPPSQGVVVDAVRPGSPAAKAGLLPGDLIVSVNGQALPDGAGSSVRALQGALQAQAPGQKVTLSVLRGEKTVLVPVVLGELLSHVRPQAGQEADRAAPMPQPAPEAGAQAR